MVSDKIKALLALTGNRQSDLAEHLQIAPQSVANKMNRDSWSAKDLIKAGSLAGAKLMFVLQNGQQIILQDDECQVDGNIDQ